MRDINDIVVYSGWIFKSPHEKKPTSPFKQFNKKKWKRLFFVLSKTTKNLPGKYELKYYTDKTCKHQRGSIDLEKCEEIIESFDSDEFQYIFSMMTQFKGKDRLYRLAPDTEEEMMIWVDNLNRVCGMQPAEPVEEHSTVPPPYVITDRERELAHLEASRHQPNIAVMENPPNIRRPEGLASHQFKSHLTSPGKYVNLAVNPEPIHSLASESSEYLLLEKCWSGMKILPKPSITDEVAPPQARSSASMHTESTSNAPPKMAQAFSMDSLDSVPGEYAPPPPIEHSSRRMFKVSPEIRDDEAAHKIASAISMDSLSSVPDEYAPPPPIEHSSRRMFKVLPEIRDDEAAHKIASAISMGSLSSVPDEYALPPLIAPHSDRMLRVSSNIRDEERSEFMAQERPHDASGWYRSPKSTSVIGIQDRLLTVTPASAVSSALQQHKYAIAKEQSCQPETSPFKTRRVSSTDDEVESRDQSEKMYDFSKDCEALYDQPSPQHHVGSPSKATRSPSKFQQFIKKRARIFRRAKVGNCSSIQKESSAMPISPNLFSIPQLPKLAVSPLKSPDLSVVSLPQKSPDLVLQSPQKTDRHDYINVGYESVCEESPPASKTKADVVTYVDLDWNTDKKPRSPLATRPLSSTEYQEIDFQKTQDLQKTNVLRTVAPERKQEKSPECSKEKYSVSYAKASPKK